MAKFLRLRFFILRGSQDFLVFLLLLLLFTITITKRNKNEPATKWKLCVSKSSYSKYVFKNTLTLTDFVRGPSQRFCLPPLPCVSHRQGKSQPLSPGLFLVISEGTSNGQLFVFKVFHFVGVQRFLSFCFCFCYCLQ